MRPCVISILALVLFVSGCSSTPKALPLHPPKKFVSDGCSLWPDLDYTDCCFAHDQAYWSGGTAQQRQHADQALRQCVSDKGRPINAAVMYVGVRIGGHGWLPTPFRWGFGHDWPEGYAK